MSKTGGGRGTNQYGIIGVGLGRPSAGTSVSRSRYLEPSIGLRPLAPVEYHALALADLTLLAEADADLSRFQPTSTQRSAARYVRRRAEFAFSSAYLEGNTFTLPEVHTLLDGRTPAGKSAADVDQILDLTEASELLIDRVRAQAFQLELPVSDELNGILARHEAIDAGVRRIHSRINQDGRGAAVNVMGDVFIGLRRDQLAGAESELSELISETHHPVLRAVHYAALASYVQMYFDGNKRTARYMMDGELMSNGFDGIAIPIARADEYQNALADMFRGGDLAQYERFLLDVAYQGDPVDG